MTFGEDQIRIRHKGKAQIMCAMRNTVITLVALAGYSNVMEAIEAFGDHQDLAFTILKKGERNDHVLISHSLGNGLCRYWA